MGTIKTTNIQSITGSGTVTIGQSGETITVPSGATINLSNATQTGVGGVNTPTFLAKLSADQTLSSSTYTKANFNTEVFDPQSTYDNSTNYRFTPAVAGKYFIYGQADFEGSDITANWIQIRKNGANIWGSHHDASGHTYTTQYIGVTDIANTTDYYEIFVYLDTTGTPKLKANFGAPLDVSFFGAYKIIE
jgi:hypothetical protein